MIRAIFLSSCLVFAALSQAQRALFVGVWNAGPGTASSTSYDAIWKDGILRMREDGTFKIYAPIYAEGTFTITKGRATLKFNRMFGQELAFMHKKVADGRLAGFRFDQDLNIRPIAGGKLINESSSSGYYGIVWKRRRPDPVRKLLDSSWTAEQMYEMEFPWDEIVERKPSPVSGLIKILKHDKEERLRISAASDLGRLNTPESTKALIAGLNDKVKGIRSTCARALGTQKSRTGVRPIMDAFNAKKIGSYTASDALGKIGDRRAVPFLLKRTKDGSDLSRSKAIEALGGIKDTNVVPELLLLTDKLGGHASAQLAKSLFLLTGTSRHAKPLVPKLITYLTDKDYLVRNDAAEGLGYCGDPSAIAPLIARMDDEGEEWSVQRQAMEALGRLRAREAISRITPYVDSADEYLRKCAKEALDRIGKPN